MLKPAVLGLAKIEIEGKSVGILRFENQGTYIVSFCFSQVDIIQCINELKKDGVQFEDGVIETFLLGAEKGGIPDFDENEKFTFDGFTSAVLSSVVINLEEIIYNQPMVDSLYEQYKISGFSSYWLPNKSALMSDTPTHVLTGFYFSANPPEAGIIHSKSHGGNLIKRKFSKKIKKLIRRSALQDDCLDPIEWLEEPAAKVFAFLNWMNSCDFSEPDA